ncbi:importin subunit alpha-like [Apium graveolens]|uniref:importin subunit alpha-like n=1 Tax=Apium graveolens TaxID=4045 RepID=UPI003D7B708D
MESEGIGVDSGKKVKRNGELANGSKAEAKFDIKQVYPFIRDHRPDDGYTISLSHEFWFDPPKIARFLDPIAVDIKREKINQLTHNITSGDRLEIEKCTKELGDMIITDPRLAGALKEPFYKLLVDFLFDDQNPVFQLNAVYILAPVVAYTANREMVIKFIEPPMMGNLLRSEDYNLRLQVLNCPDSVDNKVLWTISMTLAAICQVHPLLPDDKLKLALRAIINLLQYGSFDIASNACEGFAKLCDGNKEVLVNRDDLDHVTEKLLVLIESREPSNVINALVALGSIVRWGSDDDVQVIIDKEGLLELECLLHEKDKNYVIDPCWILSNITARGETFINAVIEHKCIKSLAGVIKKHKLVDVKEEATWAILNAIRGANSDQIICLGESVQPLWDSLKVFSDDPEIVCACLECLVKMQCVEVTSNGEKLNDAEIDKCLRRLQEKQVQLADDIEGSPKSKRLRTIDSIGKYEGNIRFNLKYSPGEFGPC